jgi:nitroreductase
MKNNIHVLLPDLTRRKSILSFSEKPVEPEILELLFEAARWAPSSMNLQPWRFIYATRDDIVAYSRLFDMLYEGNKLWAGSAPVLILSIAETIMGYKDRPNRFAFYDLGMAIGNMLIQATSMGLYVHQMGGFHVDQVKIALNIPEKYEPAAILAVGFKGDIDNLSPELKLRELKKRERRETSEFVFQGIWGER